MNVPLNVINLLTWCSDDYTDGEVDEPFHFNRPVPGRYPRAGKLTRSFIFEGLRLVLSDRFTDGEIGEPFHFNPPVPGRYPRAGGLLIIHFIDYDYLIRKNILDTSLYSIRK